MTTQVTTKRTTKSARIRVLLANRPDLAPKIIAKRTKADVSLVYEIKKKMFDASSTGAKLPKVAQVAQTKVPVFVEKAKIGRPRKEVEVKAEVKPQVKEDIIPKYSEKYTKAVDLIADYKLNFNLGSAVAHIFRANSDNKRADIKAAIWYLSNELLSTD